MISIIVAYATASQQKEMPLWVEAGSTVLEAITHSGITTFFPDIEMPPLYVGIDGKIVTLETKVKAGDRVEIYRALQTDPKELRREKVISRKKGK
jgi:putative ubiquitin-RnfH superfamily antitoxin RatB of RatAB toxin-antitoxin module